MVAKKRTNRVVSTDKYEKIDPQTQDRLVVETITTTTTTTTKKRIYVKDSNVDLTNIQSLLDDKTDTYASSAIANTASDHSCQLANSSNKKRKINEHFEESANVSYSPLSSTKVSNEIQNDEDNGPLITFDKKKDQSSPKRSATSTKSHNHKNNSPNLSCIPGDKTQDSSKAKKSKDLKKKTKTISSKIMPKTPKNFKEKHIEDLINQYISVGTVKPKAKTQSGSNYIPNSINDNHNLSDIAEATFETNSSDDDLVNGCESELAENDDFSSIVQDVNPFKLGGDEIDINIEKTAINIEKTAMQTPTTRSQRGGKRGKFITKLNTQPELKEDDNDMLESDKAHKSVKSVPTKGKKTQKITEEEKEPDAATSKMKNTKNVTKERAMNEDRVSTAPVDSIEKEQTETVKSDKRQRDRQAAEETHEKSKPTNKRSRAENRKIAEQKKSANEDEGISEATEEKLESNRRSGRRKRVPTMQKTFRRESLEKWFEKKIKKKQKAKPSKSKKLPKTKTNAKKINGIPAIPMDIAEALFEANSLVDDLVNGCGSELTENDDFSSIVQDVNPTKIGNDKIDINIVANTEKNPKQKSTTRSQKEGNRGQFVAKLKSQPEFKQDDNDMLESDKTYKSVKSVPTKGKKAQTITEEEKGSDATTSIRNNTKNATKERAVIEKQVSATQVESIEKEQTETIKSDKRQRGRQAAEETHEESKPTNKRSRAENRKIAEQTKSANVHEPISEATEEKFESNIRSSKRKRVPNMQQSARRESMEKLYEKEIKKNQKEKPSKSKKLPKTKNNDISIEPHIDELPDIHIDNEPIMPINKDLFDHKMAIYSPSSRKNFKIDSDSNVIIPEALIKSKLMKLPHARDEWMNDFNGEKQYKMNASHRLLLFVPDTMENADLTINAKGGGDVLSRIGNIRRPILVREFGTPTKN